MAKYIVVDVANLFFRCKNVVQGDAYTKAGMATHILFRSIRKVFRDHNADHVVLCLEGKSFRYDVFPNYKLSRKVKQRMEALSPKDAEESQAFKEMFAEIVEFFKNKTNVTVLQVDGAEGDDLMARWTQIHPNDEHILITGDSDVYQCLNEQIKIYDGVRDFLISIDGIKDGADRQLEFTLKSDGHLKVGKPISKKNNNETFTPEENWWRRSLFMKCIRGDSGDGIPSAYPKVREPKIIAAWDDRIECGYNWNNLMLQTWNDEDELGNKIEVRVLDAYKRNQSLIDLTLQPDYVKEAIDYAIVYAVQADPKTNIGIHFMRFCSKYALEQLNKEAQSHASYLSARYMKKENDAS